MNAIKTPVPALSFTRPLTRRGKTESIIVHHYVHPTASVHDVHRWHLNNTWAGIGYNFVIDKNGDIWQGRGMEFTGAHTENHNGTSVGIACQGNYHPHASIAVDRAMPDAQFNALVWLIRHVRERYGDIPVRGHGELRSTTCPGQFFPLDEVKRLQYRTAARRTGEDAVNYLASKGRITAPEYWIANLKNVRWLADMFIKWAEDVA
jgi:N-acetyl-anhydromuramyl-L-alanine amidase AmpD